MLQVCSTFGWALKRPHAGLCSHLDVSICGKFSPLTSSLGSLTSHECKRWQPGCINHCTPGGWHHSTLAGLSEQGWGDFGGLTEINRASLASGRLRVNSVFIKSRHWQAQLLCFLLIFIFSLIIFGCSSFFIPSHVHFGIISARCTGPGKG